MTIFYVKWQVPYVADLPSGLTRGEWLEKRKTFSSREAADIFHARLVQASKLLQVSNYRDYYDGDVFDISVYEEEIE